MVDMVFPVEKERKDMAWGPKVKLHPPSRPGLCCQQPASETNL